MTHLSCDVFLSRRRFLSPHLLPLHLVASCSFLSFQLKLSFSEKTCLSPKVRLGLHVLHSAPGVLPQLVIPTSMGLMSVFLTRI